jgi:hypothetical protein
MTSGAADMAREQARPGEERSGRERAPRKSPDAEPRRPVLSIKARSAWAAWVDRLAAFDRSSKIELVDRALARYAREIGFKEAPPER